MAYSKVLTTVANPARKRKRNMAKRKMSAKQIRHFGTKRQKAALKAKRKRHAPARKAAKRNPSKAHKRVSKALRHYVKRSVPRKRNTGEILVLTAGNPAKKGHKKAMAKRAYHHKKRAGAKHRRTNAGRRTTTHHTKHHYSRRRRNPGAIGRPMDWLKGGVGVIAGGVGTRLIPQLVMPANNTSYTGYAMNAIAAVGLAWGTHAFTKDKVLTAAVAAGGFAALILRIVNDQSSVGKYLALSGMGDYMVSNWTVPQRITDPRGAMFEMGGGGAIAPAAMAMAAEDGSGNC